MPQAVQKKKKVISLGLKAKIQPVAPGGGVPTGTVTFEVKKNKKKEITLGTVGLSGGTATLSVKPKSVLKKSITILYSGDTNFTSSSEVMTLSAASLTSMARPMLQLPMAA